MEPATCSATMVLARTCTRLATTFVLCIQVGLPPPPSGMPVSPKRILPWRKRVGARTFDRLLRLRPQIRGESVVREIERRRTRMLVGSDAKVVSPIKRAMPASYGPVSTV